MAKNNDLDSLFIRGDSRSEALEKYEKAVTANSALTYQERGKEVALREHGKKFQVRPGQERLDTLSRLMSETMQELAQELGRQPTAREVLEFLILYYKGEEIGGCLIQDFEPGESPEDDKILWLSNGKDKSLTFKAFQKRITHLRKKLLRK